ncbi:hypothetical protein K469DRAFT_103449 [Zopfia rhizophila CBS 207.26]|uniref:Uncharacterized protein n=1 Tax=Zopfia rhizophila CBS 207.26 TaxID=1314779 RepID=A0A6A6E943_9PEZI|nr:hypothetical protein K469DRAFT_103449 [Zopfia rhizophila CBS 207.26]
MSTRQPPPMASRIPVQMVDTKSILPHLRADGVPSLTEETELVTSPDYQSKKRQKKLLAAHAYQISLGQQVRDVVPTQTRASSNAQARSAQPSPQQASSRHDPGIADCNIPLEIIPGSDSQV